MGACRGFWCGFALRLLLIEEILCLQLLDDDIQVLGDDLIFPLDLPGPDPHCQPDPILFYRRDLHLRLK